MLRRAASIVAERRHTYEHSGSSERCERVPDPYAYAHARACSTGPDCQYRNRGR